MAFESHIRFASSSSSFALVLACSSAALAAALRALERATAAAARASTLASRGAHSAKYARQNPSSSIVSGTSASRIARSFGIFDNARRACVERHGL